MLSTLRTQVVVVGSGAAGVNAALAAARNGAETLLIEYNGFPGGISATLPWLGFHDNSYRQIIKGIPGEIAQRLQALDAASPFTLDVKCGSAISVDNHRYKVLLMDMFEEAGVKLMLQAQVVDTLREGDRIIGVVVEHKSGRQVILADVVIDCSGDGDVAARGGADWEKGRTGDGLVQAPTLVFRLGGVDRAGFVAGCKRPRHQIPRVAAALSRSVGKDNAAAGRDAVIVCGGFAGLVEQARQAGEHDVPQTRVVGVKLHRPDQFLVVMTRVLGLDPTDVNSLTDAYTKVYQQIPQLLRFFQTLDARLRERLSTGNRADARHPRKPPNHGRLRAGSRRLDQRPRVRRRGGARRLSHRYPPPSGTWVDSQNVQTYDIPYRCLVARNVEGLMMAGKCLSATHEGVASTRVIPICMAQGQAVGTAAALAIREHISPREVNVRELQNTLIDQGAELRQTLGEPDPALIERVGQLPLDEPPTTGESDAASQGVNAWVR